MLRWVQVAKQQGRWEAAGFALPAFRRPAKLWTSQAPTQRGPSGGFGAVTEGGYGVSYLINEDNMYLHVCYRYYFLWPCSEVPRIVPLIQSDGGHTTCPANRGIPHRSGLVKQPSVHIPSDSNAGPDLWNA